MEDFHSLEGNVASVTFSPDETKLAISVKDGDHKGCHIYDWRESKPKLLYTLCKGEGISDAIILPDNTSIALG